MSGKNVSGSEINEMIQLLIPNSLLKPSSNFNDIESRIALFDFKPFQNIENWLKTFEEVVSLFNLSHLYKLIFEKLSKTKIKKHSYKLKSKVTLSK